MKNILFVFASLVPLCARADLPLSLEDVMTDKGKLKLDASVTYINSESSRSELAAPVYIQTGAASFIPVPTEIQENGSNSDMLVGTLGLRYGLTGNTIFTAAAATYGAKTASSTEKAAKPATNVSPMFLSASATPSSKTTKTPP